MDLKAVIDAYNRTRRQEGEPVMTQRRLAALAGVAEGTVSRQARGHLTPSLPTLRAYADVLGLDVRDLVAA